MEKSRIRHFVIYMTLLAGVVLLVLAFHKQLLWGYAGLFLRDDGMVKSDAVVVAGGEFKTRLGKAVEYYKNGYADRIAIFVLRAPTNPMVRKFYPGETILSQKILEQGYGIDGYDLISRNGGVTSTYEEALALYDYCEEKKLNSITVVTDAFHSFRAGYVYEKWMDGLCQITVFPVYSEGYGTDKWWRSERDIKNYILEPIKLLNDYFR